MKRSLIGGLVILVLIILAGFLSLKIVGRNDVEWVVEKFGSAIVRNKLDKAKTYSDPKQWNRIEELTSQLESVHCLFPRNLDELEDESARIGHHTPNNTPNQANASYF